AAPELRDRRRGGVERRASMRRRDRRLRRAARDVSRDVTQRILDAVERNERAIVFTVIEGEPLGAKAIVLEGGERVGGGIPDAALEQADELNRDARNHVLELEGVRVFAEIYGPPPRLVVIGAVDTADALCSMDTPLGCGATVVGAAGTGW